MGLRSPELAAHCGIPILRTFSRAGNRTALRKRRGFPPRPRRVQSSYGSETLRVRCTTRPRDRVEHRVLDSLDRLDGVRLRRAAAGAGAPIEATDGRGITAVGPSQELLVGDHWHTSRLRRGDDRLVVRLRRIVV